ncbi:MAG TPA: Ig-like domain-containing protein [Gemmatimonadaceae bacterium]|nr:Ig-like domain-containing protein [Gemmatimonadaceae bacterium]
MTRLLATLLAALTVGPIAAQTPTTSQTVTRLRITPAVRSVAVGDSLKLRVEALDARGNVVPGVTVRFTPQGGRFQGSIDSTGMVRAGAPGTMPIAILVTSPKSSPYSEKIEVTLLPGPAARITMTPAVTRLVAGQRFHIDARVLTASGDEREGDVVTWTSSNPAVLRVSGGVTTAVSPGTATVTARAGAASEARSIQVIPATGLTVNLSPSRLSARQGDVVRFSVDVRDARGQRVAGLTPRWSFSPGNGTIDHDGSFVGNVPGTYVITADLGARGAEAVVTLTDRDVRRSADVVGRLPRSAFFTSEVWLHPDGKHLYLGTTIGGDRIYAIDVSNPAGPVITDSIVANSRSMNDMMTTADGKWLVFTREGANDRRNGIVIASTADPAHPKPVAEFTEGVTAGVHSAFVYTQPRHGTHVYLTNSGTGSLNIVDINDPTKPRLVGEWRPREITAGRALHDIDVKDGIAYVSYWSDGLVILDVGNGLKGGTPASPKLISNYRYNAEKLYPGAKADYGAGFISGTHTAWRHKNYVFIADEVFPPYAPTGNWDIPSIRAYGRLQVVDVTDIEKPKPVAWYEPEFGGVHNVWAEGDTLYIGAYNAGFHVLDVSGELRGDLKAQGRVIADMRPSAANGVVPNGTMTWGVVVRDGLAYVNDMISGLWIVRLRPRPVVP